MGIDAELARPLRRAVLRPHQDASTIVYEDDDDPRTLHLGAEIGGALVAASCIHPDPAAAGSWRVRGMAVLPEARDRGIGTAMLERLLAHADAADAAVVWCNARIRAVPLYERCGFVVVSEEFELAEIGPHVRMERRHGA